MNKNYVYIAEAWKNGKRIERIVHTNEADAWEDIEISTNGEDPDKLTVEKERLYLGQDDEYVATV